MPDHHTHTEPPDDERRTESSRDAHRDSLGSVVRLLRKRSGLSLAEVAARVGCAKSYLSAIETGKRPAPGRDLLARLEACLDAEAGVLGRLADRERAPDSVLEAESTRLRAKISNEERCRRSRQLV